MAGCVDDDIPGLVHGGRRCYDDWEPSDASSGSSSSASDSDSDSNSDSDSAPQLCAVHVFEHLTGYRLGEADCCVRILWAGDMSDDMEDEAVSAQHRARLVLAAQALLGESRGITANPGFTWEGHVKDMNESSSSFVTE